MAVLCFAFSAVSQNYTSDAILKSATDKIATLEVSGIARAKKDAIEMAKKSAIYTYLFYGIDGLDGGKPLLGPSPSGKAVAYVGEMLGGTKYANYIRSATEARKSTKTAGKETQVLMTIELYTESLRRDLVNNGLIGRPAADTPLDMTAEMIAMPSVMVVPFRSGRESYEDAIRKNSNMRVAISKVNEGFIDNGVETKDLLTSLNNANTYQVRQGDGMSLDDAILINSGADVSVSVDINVDSNSNGVVVSLTLQAVEVATGNTLATKSEVSARKRTSVDMLCGVMAQSMTGDFMKQISNRMATKISTGQSVSVRFTIDPSSPINMDTEINNTLPLSDILVGWVKRHAQNGKYRTQGRTATLLSFSDIYVDNSMENGMQSDVNDFALALYQYLRGLNITVSRTITGNSIDIIIY